jgi:hypothetical protein
VFSEQRHQSGGILAFDFLLDVLVELGKYFVAGNVVRPDIFKHAQKPLHDPVRELIFLVKAITNSLEDVFYFHAKPLTLA